MAEVFRGVAESMQGQAEMVMRVLTAFAARGTGGPAEAPEASAPEPDSTPIAAAPPAASTRKVARAA